MAIARQFDTDVSTSATAIGGTQYPGFLLKNTHATETLYIGDSAVTISNGFPIEPGQTYSPPDLAHNSITGRDSDRLYGISPSATIDVRVLLQSRPNV